MAKKILIVEDDKFVGELYEHSFTKHGYEVFWAQDGEVALSLASQNSSDIGIVLLDIMIPKIDGLEVLKRLKADQATKNLTVVVLSNLGQEEIIKQALASGAKAYIVKSLYTPEQVVAEVRSILGA